LIAISQATQEEDGDIIFSLTGSNTTSNTVKFALPIVYGLLGIFEFLLIGLLLIKYYSKRPEVNNEADTI